MPQAPLFKWRHFTAEVILCAVRWYLRYALSYRDVEELMRERGVAVDHTTVFRWVQRYALELETRCRLRLKATNDSYRVDETSIKIKKPWHDLYRAVDSAGYTIDFMLSVKRDAKAAERLFREVLRGESYRPTSCHHCRSSPSVSRMAKNLKPHVIPGQHVSPAATHTPRRSDMILG